MLNNNNITIILLVIDSLMNLRGNKSCDSISITNDFTIYLKYAKVVEKKQKTKKQKGRKQANLNTFWGV